MRRRTAVAAVVTAALAAGCSWPLPAGRGGDGARPATAGGGVVQVVPAAERHPGPTLTGRTLEGKQLEPGDFAGHVVVVNAWGSWCPPCREEADDLEAVHRKRRGDGVRFVGVTVKDNTAAARSFQKRHGITYPSIDPGDEILLGFRTSLPAHAPPVTWVIDRDGRVAARVLGAVTQPTLDGLVSDVLAEAS